MSHRLVAHMGSLRHTLTLLVLLGVAALARPTWGVFGVVVVALALNLAAALAVHPLLRRQLPLLVSHLALLALVAIVGVGKLVKLDGRFELLQGEPFDGRLLDHAAGAWADVDLARLALRNEGFTIDYAPGHRRGATRNAVAWRDEHGNEQRAVIGDHRPLVVGATRLYTSPNKGFAPLLRWQPARGEPVRGAVHLPSYPMHALRQSREWTLPDGRAVWLMLQLPDEPLIARDAPAQFRLPGVHRLVVRVGDARHELAPGDAIPLDGGVLLYEGLRPWMGYRVSHDPTLPWLLAAALTASLALALHYAIVFIAPRPQGVPATRASHA